MLEFPASFALSQFFRMYLGEQLRPDGLNVGDLGGGDEGLELVGLLPS